MKYRKHVKFIITAKEKKLRSFLYLLKAMFVFLASSFNCKLCTKYVTKFCTIAIASTCKNNIEEDFNSRTIFMIFRKCVNEVKCSYIRKKLGHMSTAIKGSQRWSISVEMWTTSKLVQLLLPPK